MRLRRQIRIEMFLSLFVFFSQSLHLVSKPSIYKNHLIKVLKSLILATPNSNLMNLGGAQDCGWLRSFPCDLMQVIGTRLGEILGLRFTSNLLDLVGPFLVSFLSDVWDCVM